MRLLAMFGISRSTHRFKRMRPALITATQNSGLPRYGGPIVVRQGRGDRLSGKIRCSILAPPLSVAGHGPRLALDLAGCDPATFLGRQCQLTSKAMVLSFRVATAHAAQAAVCGI